MFLFVYLAKMSGVSVLTSDYVNVSITNSASATVPVERRFQKSIQIQEFKVFLTVSRFCVLQLFRCKTILFLLL